MVTFGFILIFSEIIKFGLSP